MKVVKFKRTPPIVIEDVIDEDGKKKISIRYETPEERWREFYDGRSGSDTFYSMGGKTEQDTREGEKET